MGEHDVAPFEVRGSHAALLETLPPPPLDPDPTPPGLVMVPGSRAVHALSTAVAIAVDLAWPLLVLSSKGMTAPRVRRELSGVDRLTITAADVLPGGALRPLRSWATPDHPEARRWQLVDTHLKRNLALGAAAMTGLDHILLVDDDVFALTPADVRRALAHLRRVPEHAFVGWPLIHFADNSVAHHARRDVLHRQQGCFIGGGALLVRLSGRTPSHFPPVYNEDWLFLYDALARREVVVGRGVGQLAYDPYEDPQRAVREEFGDVLGEGLFHLLHVGAPVEVAADPLYWTSVLRKRTRMQTLIVERLRDELASNSAGGADRLDRLRLEAALHAISAGRAQLTRVTAVSLADFVCRWRHDEQVWAEFYERLPRRDSLKQALIYLGLHDAWIVEGRSAA